MRKFRAAARRLLRENMRWVRAAVITSPLMDLLGAIVIPLLLLYARGQIQHGIMTTGQFFTFIYAMFNAYMPLKRMGNVYQQFQAAQGASTQVFAYLDLEPGKYRAARRKNPARHFHAKSNSTASASATRRVRPWFCKTYRCKRAKAKSSLLSAPAAREKPRWSICSRVFTKSPRAQSASTASDIREVTIRSLRDQIAMVAQENILFYDTVWNNICYGLTGVAERTRGGRGAGRTGP